MYGILSFSLSTQNMMAFCSGSINTQACVPFLINHLRSSPAFTACRLRKNHVFHHHQSIRIDTLSRVMVRPEAEQCNNSHRSFLQGSRICIVRGGSNTICRKRSSIVHASLMPSADIASNAFTFGTLSVLPFYTLMVLAPRADFTKNLLASSIPYVVLGLLYGYLLHLSWTSDTACLIFATKYLLPLLSTISKLFSREMSVASAWIHLLAVDLFAARQVYFDGLQENIETRHSVLICLFFCPLGILTHFITKALTRSREETDQGTNL